MGRSQNPKERLRSKIWTKCSEQPLWFPMRSCLLLNNNFGYEEEGSLLKLIGLRGTADTLKTEECI